MNNCPKCGNPLQVGVTSCPICGTNIANTSNEGSAESAKQPVQTSQVSVAQNKVNVSQAVAPTPVSVQPSSNNVTPVVEQQLTNDISVASVASPSQVDSNVQQAPQSVIPGNQVVQAPPVVQTIAEATPVAQVQHPNVQDGQETSSSASVNPSNAVTTPQVSVMPQATVEQPIQQSSKQEPVVQTVSQTPIVPTSVVPTVGSVPVTGIPSSLTGTVVPNLGAQNIESPKDKDKKEKNNDKSVKNNKKLAFVVAIALVVVFAGALYIMLGSKFKLKSDLPKDEEEKLAMSSVISHGFKFGLQDGWLVSEDQNNVVLSNSADTVSIRLSQSPTSITEITEDIINDQLSRNQSFSEATVTSTQIGARDSYVVNAILNETLPVQIYFIGGGTSLTLGVTVIYQSAETKSKLEPNILEMIGGISYSDDSIKAISTISMYNEAFNMFNNVVTNKQPEEPEVPNEENPNNQGDENNEENQTPEEENQNPVTENPSGQVTE